MVKVKIVGKREWFLLKLKHSKEITKSRYLERTGNYFSEDIYIAMRFSSRKDASLYKQGSVINFPNFIDSRVVRIIETIQEVG